MKIRLLGSADLVRDWAHELEREYGVRAALYPSRRGGDELRAYIDLDDRTAELVLKTRSAAAAATSVKKRLPSV